MVAKGDEVITIYGGALLLKHGSEKVNLISQHMRDLARLLMQLRQLCHVPALQLKQAVKPEFFDKFVEATRTVSGFDKKERNLNQYKAPSSAQKIGYATKKAALIGKGQAIRCRDSNIKKDVDDFLSLYDGEWSEKVSSNALNALAYRKHNKPETLPLTEYLVKLRQ